jgi:hypothetical protein
MPGTSVIVWRKYYIKARKPPKTFRTICEVLRELYRDAEARGDAISMTRLEECNDMAKRMQRKLEEYKPDAPYITADGEHERRNKK